MHNSAVYSLRTTRHVVGNEGQNVEIDESLPVWLRVGRGWDILWESVPKMSHEAKRKGLAWLQALDFLSGAAGDRTPDLMTASHAAVYHGLSCFMLTGCFSLSKNNLSVLPVMLNTACFWLSSIQKVYSQYTV